MDNNAHDGDTYAALYSALANDFELTIVAMDMVVEVITCRPLDGGGV